MVGKRAMTVRMCSDRSREFMRVFWRTRWRVRSVRKESIGSATHSRSASVSGEGTATRYMVKFMLCGVSRRVGKS